MGPSYRAALFAVLLMPSLMYGCSCGSGDDDGATTNSGGAANSAGGAAGAGGGSLLTGGSGVCQGLECQQVNCPGGGTTSISGTVYEPGGTLPLYNVLVFVPNAPLDPIPVGASCDKCGNVSGEPIVTAITGTDGTFVLEDVPAGDDIPLVIQVGKWRRELTIPQVPECEDTALTDVESTSLPSNQREGDIPRIALTTGGADPLECLLRKIGLDEEEFTLSTESGRVNLFSAQGGSQAYAGSLNGGAALEPAEPFWSDLNTLMNYDLALLACEGGQNLGQKSPAARQAMQDYANAGGRIFMGHWHNAWLEQGPAPWPTTAVWNFQNDPPEPYTGVVDQTFPKGEALAEWLVNVSASTVLGELPITQPQHTLDTVDAPLVTQWIYGLAPDAGSVKYFTFNTPSGAPDDELCGRVVFSDIHVSSGDSVGVDFPDGCTTVGLTPQEKALVFMLFDLSSCIIPDDEPPEPPK